MPIQRAVLIVALAWVMVKSGHERRRVVCLVVDSVSTLCTATQTTRRRWTVNAILGRVVLARRRRWIVQGSRSTELRNRRLSEVACGFISCPRLFIENFLVEVVGRGVLEAAATARRQGLVLRSQVVAIVRHSEKGVLGIDGSGVEYEKGERAGSRKDS
jgi:hypothetical protein